MATESRTRLVLVDARLVGQEVLVDGEGSCDGTVLLDVLLDLVDAAELESRLREVFVRRVSHACFIGARRLASGCNLCDVITRGKRWDSDVVSALRHGVVVASASGAVVSASDDTLTLEPGPRSKDLATIAAKGEALVSIAASGGISYRKESGEVATGRDTNTVIEGLSGTMSPA